MYKLNLQDFDKTIKENVGRPYYFNVDKFLSVVEEFIASDEVTIALHMLNNMPGWYRDNYPPEAKSIRDQLYKKLYTTIDYTALDFDPDEMNQLMESTKEEINNSLMHQIGRASLALQLCERLNSQDITPYIYEIAPGSYWLPIGLQKNAVKFDYHGLGLNKDQNDLIKYYLEDDWSDEPPVDNKAKLFVCYELIEHLYSPDEIYQNYLKANIEFTHILLSTPKYCVRNANPAWYESDLGHLRTYTPREFIDFAIKHWPEFEWKMYDGDVMILIGEKKSWNN